MARQHMLTLRAQGTRARPIAFEPSLAPLPLLPPSAPAGLAVGSAAPFAPATMDEVRGGQTAAATEVRPNGS